MRKIFILILFVFSLFSAQTNAFAQHQEPLQLRSEAAVLMDSTTGAVLYSKNGNVKMYPASLTKIATAIYAIENGNLEDRVVISHNAVNTEGTRVYLEEGEVVTLHHLIQGMLINSGNDAAVAIAEHIDGDIEKFSKSFNEYLKKQIGVSNTHFSNPNGLFGEDHYTTAEDLAKITNYALKNKVFKDIFGTKELVWDGLSWDTTLFTHHQMLKGEVPYSGVTGGKTGFVNESKQTLATTAENGNMKLTAIALKADYKRDIYNDTKQLLDFGFQHFKTSYLPKSKTFTINNKTFQPEKSTVISEPLEGAVYEVTKHGELKVQTQNQDTIQVVQLKRVKEREEEPVSGEPETEDPFTRMNALFGTIVVMAAGAVYKVTKRKRK